MCTILLYFGLQNLLFQFFRSNNIPAKYLKPYILKGYKLCFSHKTQTSVYGHANIIKSKNSKVPGAIWKITKADENELDGYEGVDYNYYDSS